MRVLALSECAAVQAGNSNNNNFNYLESLGAVSLGAILAGGVGFLATGLKYPGLIAGAFAGAAVFFVIDVVGQEISML